MAKGTRICKICGKEYEYCHTQRPKGTSVWQDVACCEEHAIEYFELVEKARNPIKEETPVAAVSVEVETVTDAVVENEPAVEVVEVKKPSKKRRTTM